MAYNAELLLFRPAQLAPPTAASRRRRWTEKVFCVTEPHFLHAIDYGNYVYFFLSELAVEYTALGKVPNPGSTACTARPATFRGVASLSPGGVFPGRPSVQER